MAVIPDAPGAVAIRARQMRLDQEVLHLLGRQRPILDIQGDFDMLDLHAGPAVAALTPGGQLSEVGRWGIDIDVQAGDAPPILWQQVAQLVLIQPESRQRRRAAQIDVQGRRVDPWLAQRARRVRVGSSTGDGHARLARLPEVTLVCCHPRPPCDTKPTIRLTRGADPRTVLAIVLSERSLLLVPSCAFARARGCDDTTRAP